MTCLVTKQNKSGRVVPNAASLAVCDTKDIKGFTVIKTVIMSLFNYKSHPVICISNILFSNFFQCIWFSIHISDTSTGEITNAFCHEMCKIFNVQNYCDVTIKTFTVGPVICHGTLMVLCMNLIIYEMMANVGCVWGYNGWKYNQGQCLLYHQSTMSV